MTPQSLSGLLRGPDDYVYSITLRQRTHTNAIVARPMPASLLVFCPPSLWPIKPT